MLHWRLKNLGLGFAKLLAMLSRIRYKYDKINKKVKGAQLNLVVSF